MEDLITRITPFFREYQVKKAALFGSVARGEETDASDLDLLVSFLNPKYDLLDICGLKLAIEDEIGRPVDIVTYPSLRDDSFARQVLRDERVIYEQS